MLTIKRLMERKATTGDKRLAVTEMFFHAATGELRYVALRTGGLFKREDVLVSTARFDAPPEGSEDWPLDLDEAAVAEAPTWAEGGQGEPPLALEAWPPIIVGPFGTTNSPLLLYAGLAAEQGAAATPSRIPDPRVDRLERASRRIGAEVFGADGPLGRLEDMIVDRAELRITHFVLSGEPSRQVPYSALRHMPDEGDHVVLDLDAPALADAPPAQA